MLDGNQNVPFQPYGQQPQQQPPISGPPTFNTNPVNHNFNQNIMSQQVQGKPEKPVSIQKGPIPEEHLHMKTVLDELRAQCSNATNNLVCYLLIRKLCSLPKLTRLKMKIIFLL